MSIEVTASPTRVSSLAGGAAVSTAKQELDSEVFLSLLVAQLRNQDPSSPMDTNEMMAQQTQLASMERLTELATTSQEQFSLTMRMAAMSVVGTQVSYTGANGEVVSGTAASASFAGPVPTLRVGDTDVALDAILSASSSTPTTGA